MSERDRALQMGLRQSEWPEVVLEGDAEHTVLAVIVVAQSHLRGYPTQSCRECPSWTSGGTRTLKDGQGYASASSPCDRAKVSLWACLGERVDEGIVQKKARLKTRLDSGWRWLGVGISSARLACFSKHQNRFSSQRRLFSLNRAHFSVARLPPGISEHDMALFIEGHLRVRLKWSCICFP